jgi:hypothetical protein
MGGTGRGFVGFFVLAILVAGCKHKPVLSRSAFSEEQLSVYRGLLDTLSVIHSKNLSTASVPFDFVGFPETRPCLRGIELENISEAQRTTHIFGEEITKGRDLKLVDRHEQIRIWKQRDAARNIQNEKLTGEPEQGGSELNFLVLSEIAFDKEHRFAVLKYLLVCGEHCAGGATLVMEKMDGKWNASAGRPACALLVGY